MAWPKSTACICVIWENKMTGGETASFAPERKYGMLSETFYKSYTSGEEPEDESWVMDWAEWAGAYKIFLRRKAQYHHAIQALREHSKTLVDK
jgi:hypothetical protein